MKLIIKVLGVAATVGLFIGNANANTTSKHSTTIDSSRSSTSYGTTPSTYDTPSDTTTTTIETTGAPRTATKTTTVLDQSTGTTQDVEVTRKIREDLNSKSGLSTAAKNVEVITVGNAITLRGKVASQAEKQEVATAAEKFSGTRSVHNELTIDTSAQ